MPPGVVGRRPRCPATTAAARRATRADRYPADPPTVEEIVAVLRCAGKSPKALRVRALIVILWRAGLRISEALALAEGDLDRVTGAVPYVAARAASVVRSAWTAGAGSSSRHGRTLSVSALATGRMRHRACRPCLEATLGAGRRSAARC